MKTKTLITALALTVAGLTSASIAHSDGEKRGPDAEYRHTVMEGVKYSFLGILANIRGDVDMPPEHVASLAASLRAFAEMSPAAFKKDTRGQDGPSDSKDAVWEDWADFSSRLDTFISDTKALELAAASGEQAAITAAFRKAGGNCKSCHDKYRAE